MSEIILKVEALKTYFHTFSGVVKAVDCVDLNVREGEILGVVGESGSGKSVMSYSLLKLVEEPGTVDAEKIQYKDENLLKKSESEMMKIRGKEIAMIFQDPMTSLNPLYTIQQQIEEVLILHQELSVEERYDKCIELLTAVGIPNPKERMKSYPHQFSGGMRQRVIIAIALAGNPKLIIADEPTTALDVTIQNQILRLLKKLVRENGLSLILITHDLAVVAETADRINVMYCGRIIESGLCSEIIHDPQHPYTKGLINSIPRLWGNQERLEQIPGIVPSLMELPEGCSFAPRCDCAEAKCRIVAPMMLEYAKGHRVACHFVEKKVSADG